MCIRDREEHSILILELVHCRRLTDSGAGGIDRAQHLLIQMGEGNITREGQVLDGSPSGDETNLPNVVIGVADSSRAPNSSEPRGGPERTADAADTAEQTLSRVVVTDRGPGAV